MVSTLGLTGTSLNRLTDMDNPVMGQIVPTGSSGLMFIAVEAGTLARVMMIDVMESDPAPLDLVPPNLPSGVYPCLTTGWQSPAYSPAGDLKAFGYHCKVEEGPDIPSKTAVVVYDHEDQECGDPVYSVEGFENIEDVAFTYDSSMVIYSVGHHAALKRVFARVTEVSDGITITSAARQITDEGTYRRPRWVTNLSREKAQPEAGVARPRW
jgi:hypothetical protein